MSIPFGQFLTHSAQETFELAHSIGRLLETPAKFFLEGDLGAGKTVFAKGMICGLGQTDPDDVPSPSFTLINEYTQKFKVYHIDLYRLDSAEDIKSLDLEEIFAEPAVIIVEWGEKLAGMKIKDVIHVEILSEGTDIRTITISARKGRSIDEA
jgi:tRNA threonylcarbamoyladenosine biosynthesis protein TsaE